MFTSLTNTIKKWRDYPWPYTDGSLKLLISLEWVTLFWHSIHKLNHFLIHLSSYIVGCIDDKLHHNIVKVVLHKKTDVNLFFTIITRPKTGQITGIKKFLNSKSDVYKKLICIKQRVQGRVFKFYLSVLLLMIKTSQSVHEKLDSSFKNSFCMDGLYSQILVLLL